MGAANFMRPITDVEFMPRWNVKVSIWDVSSEQFRAAYLEVVDFSQNLFEISVFGKLCPGDSVIGLFGVRFSDGEMYISVELG
jgi:hypothetical protein